MATTVEKFLEGFVTKKFIQEFDEQEALSKQKVKEARAKIEAFEVEIPKSE
jgi:hypothetical protein